MKLYSKLSALGAVLVLATAFASADTIIDVNSGSGSTFYVGYSAVAGGPFALQPGGVNNTPTVFPNHAYSVDPGVPVWAAAGPGSTWVSYDPNSGPTGGETTFDWNGFYEYGTSFTTAGLIYNGSVTVAADDTTAVFMNGVEILGPGALGSDAHCADDKPNCLAGGSSTVLIDDHTPGFNTDGANFLTFVVTQSGSYYQGLDYYGSIVGTTPEPNTLMLLGTGLLGSAGALFRRMRAAA